MGKGVGRKKAKRRRKRRRADGEGKEPIVTQQRGSIKRKMFYRCTPCYTF